LFLNKKNFHNIFVWLMKLRLAIREFKRNTVWYESFSWSVKKFIVTSKYCGNFVILSYYLFTSRQKMWNNSEYINLFVYLKSLNIIIITREAEPFLRSRQSLSHSRFFLHFLKLKFHCCAHNNHSLVPILSHINLCYIILFL
jgi:hypothetical protein